MLIKKLQITGMRSIKQAEFTFQPGMNLIVGVNGVGKTTVLAALSMCLSRILAKGTLYTRQRMVAPTHAITVGMDSVQVSCDFEWNDKVFNLLINRQRSKHITNKEGKIVDTPDTEIMTPDLSDVFPMSKSSSEQPIGLFFSARRSTIIDREVTKSSAVGGQAAAFVEPLSASRIINLRPIAEWFYAQIELAKETPALLRYVGVLRKVIEDFLPGFRNLRVSKVEEEIGFEIEKNGVPLRINQLSEGEKGVLAIVLDLARRLSQANPDLEDPVKDGVAVVLIDELDLHLHPRWQRTIVENLTRTFQSCQFIATTHSPQIIGEVKSERITIIGDTVYSPSSSFGMDSSRVLEEIMDTAPRNTEVDELLSTLSQKIDEEKLPVAKELLDQLRKMLGPNDPEVTRSATMIDFLESEVNE